MNVADLKRHLEKRPQTEHFFSRNNMRFSGDSMRNFGVRGRGEYWELFRFRRNKRGLIGSAAFFRKDDFSQHHYCADGRDLNEALPYDVLVKACKPEELRIFDNDGKTADRYTVVPPRWRRRDYYDRRRQVWQALGASEHPFHPQGFGQHVEVKVGRHLGKRIKFEELPEDVQQWAKQEFCTSRTVELSKKAYDEYNDH